MKTTFSWLHLTDLHFGLQEQNFLWPNLRQAFLDDIIQLHQRTGPWHAVLFTGDLVQQGKSDEFRAMQQEVLTLLWDKLAELGSGDAVLLAVPGNHDLFRPDATGDNPAVDGLLIKGDFERIATKFWDNPGGAYRRVVNEAFAAYTEWWQAAPHRPSGLTNGIIPGDFACTLELQNQRIGIVGLNTAFLQLAGGDYHGKLVWDTRQLQAVCGGAVDKWLDQHTVCLLLSHQGPDWLTPEARAHGQSEIAPAGRFAAHLFGHMHETEIKNTRIGGGPNPIWHLQGCSVFGMELMGEPPKMTRTHGYAVGQITIEAGKASMRLWPRIATNKPAGSGWRYIPDSQQAVLQDDHGTAADGVACRAKSTGSTDGTNGTLGAGGPVSAGLAPGATIAANATTASAPAAPHSNLPARRAFFGRKDELATIAKYLRPDHQGWGVVLDGPGGMGKTALALEAAHLAPSEYFPLKLFITAKTTRLDSDGEHGIADNRVVDYVALLGEIGLALGRDDIQRAPDQQRAALVRNALAAQRVLLVLDNLETFTRQERRRVYELLDILPAGCRAIVTSRRRDETAARSLRLDRLDKDAVKQLIAGLRERNPSIPPLLDEQQHMLYEETGGNPLLLTWVVQQLGRAHSRCRTFDDAVRRLREAHQQEKINPRNDPLEFVFGDLLDTFTPAETAVLAALAHFDQAARFAWLLPLTELRKTAALTALDDLRDRALLIEDQANETWFLPSLCGHFLRQRRPEAVGAAGLRLEKEGYALALRHGGNGKYPYAALEDVWPSVQAALPLLVAGENARLQAVCDALDQFLDFTGRWDVRLALRQDGEAKALAARDDNNAGWCAYRAGWVHLLQGEAKAVLACAERCAKHWQRAGAGTRESALAIGLRGQAHRLQKDYSAAIAAFRQALELLRSQNPESADVATCLSSLAIAKKEAGDLDAAEADYREALRIAGKIGDKEGVAINTGNLSELYLARKDWPAAERLALEALTLAEGIGRLELIACNNQYLAEAMCRQQRAAEALPHARRAVAFFTPLRSVELAKAAATLADCEAACRA